MIWSTLVWGAKANFFNFSIKCKRGKYIDPEFSVDIYHLQDASPANFRGRELVKDVYTDLFTELLSKNVPVRFGTGGFVDDDGVNGESGRFCYKAVTDLSSFSDPVDALERVNMVPGDQSNYDQYEAGFKAMMLAGDIRNRNVKWSDDPKTLKLLITGSNAAPKVKDDVRRCPANFSDKWNSCREWITGAYFQSSSECLSVTNQPTYDEFVANVRRDLYFMNFVYYHDASLEGYYGARSKWAQVAYELSSRGIPYAFVDEGRYYDMANVIGNLIEKLACIPSSNTTTTTTTKSNGGNILAECQGRLSSVCYCEEDKGQSYRGPVHVTASNTGCIKWSSAWKYTDLPGDSCRNPEQSGSQPWCYTDGQGTWGYCPSIPMCGCSGFDPDYCGCRSVDLADYRGTVNKTRSGYTCQRWSEQSPNTHPYDPNSEKYGDQGLDENNCRNPLGEASSPWCYVVDGSVRWDYCDVPVCEER